MFGNKNIILASASPRRKKLMSYLDTDFSVVVPDVDENINEEDPVKFVLKLSHRKANFVYQNLSKKNSIVIGADTIVSYKGDIFGKPNDEKEAFDMLSLLSNRTHQVYTGVSIVTNTSEKVLEKTFFEKTDVTFCNIPAVEIKSYIPTGEPMDKAGAYAVQGKFSVYIKSINGDYNNVVGLPVCRLYNELLDLIS